MSVKPASQYSRTASTIASRSGPHGMDSGDVLRPHELRGAGEARRRRQVGVDRPAAAEPAELVVGAFHGGVAVGIPADRDLPDHPDLAGQSGGPPRVVPRVDELLVGFDGDQMVGQRGERLDRLLAGHRGGDGDRDVGDVPHPGGVDLEVLALPVDQLAGEQLADDLDRLTSMSCRRCDRRPAACRRRAR